VSLLSIRDDDKISMRLHAPYTAVSRHLTPTCIILRTNSFLMHSSFDIRTRKSALVLTLNKGANRWSGSHKALIC
jgi:hypothetical protein